MLFLETLTLGDLTKENILLREIYKQDLWKRFGLRSLDL